MNMGVKKRLNHLFYQALFYYLHSREKQQLCPFFMMYKDKLSGANAMLEELDCNKDLQEYSKNLLHFINKLDQTKTDDIIAQLSAIKE